MDQSELFTLLLEKPGLYIGHGSVDRAKAFVDGYTFSIGNVDSQYKGFNRWIADRFTITTTHDWASIVSFIGGSETGAFELAKELWKEYREGRASRAE